MILLIILTILTQISRKTQKFFHHVFDFSPLLFPSASDLKVRAST